jgi:hypothetical protein
MGAELSKIASEGVEPELKPLMYRLRVGKEWVASLVAKPGGCRLTPHEGEAELFKGHVRTPELIARGIAYGGMSMMAWLARSLLGRKAAVWAAPCGRFRGFWVR